MPIVKTRTPAQMGKFLDAFLAKTIPAGSAGVAIVHTPDPGADPGPLGAANNSICWRGFGGPLEGRLALAAYLREVATSLETGVLN